MKKTLMAIVVLASVFTAFAAEEKTMSIADARAQIGDAVKSPEKMGAIMKSLSAADQKTFLVEVNAAVAKLPGSTEEKASLFVELNESALKNAKKGNLVALLCETYATVPPEALPAVSERFAADLFARDADPSRKYTDKQFESISTDVSGQINKRNETVDRTAVRDTFGVLMFLRASGGTPANLSETLVKGLPEDAQELARKEWIPPAMSAERDYGPLLGAAGADEHVLEDLGLRLYQPASEDIVPLLADLASMSKFNLDKPVFDAVINPEPVPTINNRFENTPIATPSEPQGYPGQL